MDEQPYQRIKETRVPLPATRTHGERVDYSSERNGTASIFMFTSAALWLSARNEPAATNQRRLGPFRSHLLDTLD